MEWVIQKQVQRNIQAKSLRAGADYLLFDAQIICQWLFHLVLSHIPIALEPHVKQRHIGPNGMQDEVGVEERGADTKEENLWPCKGDEGINTI